MYTKKSPLRLKKKHGIHWFLLLFFIAFITMGHYSHAQTRGQIIKPGDPVLDPNGDGYVSDSSDGFSIDGYYVDEFELHMFGLPFAGDGETSGDGTQNCSTTDLATDTTGFSVYGVLDGDNLIFRFRLAGDRPSVEAYTILIDSDNLIGPEDPNYSPDNPGFEVDITLVKNASQGVYLYDIDGVTSCPSQLALYPYSTHFQSSVAGTTSCADADYFYDFYIPFADLTTHFGITTQSELRFFAVTNVSATCALGGSISDVGGVNDELYASFEEMYLELSANQCPTTLDDLCQTCDGFKVGVTEKPTIDQPIKAGETVVTGTAEANADIYMSVFDVNSTLIEDVIGATDANGFFEITLSNALQMEDSITARAQIPGSCSSGISESDISYAVAIINNPPVISGTTSALIYSENGPGLSIFDDFTISDVDDSEMDSAWLSITTNYEPTEDLINLPANQGLSVTWNAAEQRVEIYGIAPIATYESIIRGITYSNSSEDPIESVKTFTVQVHDGLDESNIISRDLTPAKVNDPSVVTGTGTVIPYDETSTDVFVEEGIDITDIDDTQLTGARVSITFDTYFTDEDTLKFTDQNGITGSFNDVSGVLNLSGTATLANYIAAIQSIQYYNKNAADNPAVKVNPLSRVIRTRVFDGEDSSNVVERVIDMIEANEPPVIVDEGGNPVDTVQISMLEDIPLDTCIEAVDPDGDPIILDTAWLVNEQGTIEIASEGLCFVYTPTADFSGQEYIHLVSCDIAPECDTLVVDVTVLPVNDEPVVVDESNNPIDTAFYATDEDTPQQFCVDAVDIEGNDLELANVTSLSGNSSSVIADPSSLCFDYTPNLDFNGNDTLSVVVCEVGSTTQCDTLIAIVEVAPINDPPVIETDPSSPDSLFFEAQEDVIESFCVVANDPDNTNLNVVSATTLEGPGSFDAQPLGDLCFSFLGDLNAVDTVYGQVIVCDNESPALCDTIVAVVGIIPMNDPPVVEDENGAPLFTTDTIFIETLEDISVDSCVIAQDPDGDTLLISSITSNDGNGTYSLTSDLCFSFTPNPDFNGRDVAQVTVCEDRPDSLCTSVIIAVDVLPVNDPPQITDGTNPIDSAFFEVNEDDSLEICLQADDIDGNPVSVTEILTESTDGTFDNETPGDMCFVFTPEEDFNGEVVGEVIICDNQDPALCDTVVTVITVLPVNDPPFVEDENGAPLVSTDTLFMQTFEDTPLDSCVSADDPDNDPLAISLITSNDGNGSYATTSGLCFSYTPDPNFNGRDIGQVYICEQTTDSLCGSVIIAVDVIPVNDPPVIENADGNPADTLYYNVTEDEPSQLCIAGDDIDGDAIEIVGVQVIDGVNATINGVNGLCFTFNPEGDVVGTSTVEIVVADNNSPVLHDTAIAIINVLPINDPPFFVGVGDTLTLTTDEDVPVSFELTADDPDGDVLAFSPIDSETSLGSYDPTATGNTMNVTFTPSENINGVEYATITVCDGGVPEYCDVLTLEINITPVNDAPIAVNDTVYVIRYQSVTANVLENDSDIEGHNLSVSTNLEREPLRGSFKISADGTFTYKPSANFEGEDGFTYVVCDDGDPSECSTADVTIIVDNPLIVYQTVSPNGDGMNDTWVIEGIENYPRNTVKIFDRFNRIVYETTGYNNQNPVWIGQSNKGLIRSELPEGTYFYLITIPGSSEPLSGYLMLKVK